MNKKLVWLVTLLLLAASTFADAQQPVKTSRVGYVSTVGSPDANFEELRQGLRDLGYIEGKNIAFEYRGAQGKAELIPGFIAELVQMKVDLLFCPNLPAIHAAKEATKTIPIVMISNVDPVELGVVESFAKPGGNITGMTLQSLELSGKRLELLKRDLSQTQPRGAGLERGRSEHEFDYQTGASRRAAAWRHYPAVRGARPERS